MERTLTKAQEHIYGHVFKEIAELVSKTSSPSDTKDAWLQNGGDYMTLRHVVAVAVNICSWDGRIDPIIAEKTRCFTNEGTGIHDRINNLDNMHMTHLNQLAQELFGSYKVRAK